MKRNAFLFSFLLILLATSSSCKKSIEAAQETSNSILIPQPSPVTGRVSGIIVDENNAPVSSAEVNIGTAVYYTDVNGTFHSADLTLDKYITSVTVRKAGYFKAFRSFSATASRNFVSIKLIPKVLTGTIDASGGGNITLSGGSTIHFSANSFVVEGQGTNYNGGVNVYAAYIDPTRADFASIVPGSMLGKDDSYLYVLQSAGMLAVELESASGQALQLVSGKPAFIELIIPESLRSKAPTVIDTWSLDDKGVWIREEQARKEGDHYQMEASHFSFWNVDVPSSAVFLTVNAQNQSSQPLSNALIQLSVINNTQWWATTAGITDSSGTAAGFVPANLPLELAAYANDLSCTSPFHAESIGSFSIDASINITVVLTPAQAVTVAGTATDCNSLPLAAGTVAILAGPYNLYYAPVTNGSYSVQVPVCYASTSVTVIVGDSISGDYSDPMIVALSGPVTVVPVIAACNGNAATYTFTGYPTTCPPYIISGTYLPGVTMNSQNSMSVSVNVTGLGSYLISTNTANGIRFGAGASFTTLGMQTVLLSATGTPLSPGSYNYIPVGAGANSQGCMVTIGF